MAVTGSISPVLSVGVLKAGGVTSAGMAKKQQVRRHKKRDPVWSPWSGLVDLSGEDLSGRYLGHALLGGANLAHANLTSANLTQATLERADLSGANLSRADLYRARMWCADLSYAKLTRAKLREVLAPEVDLTGALMHGADLTGARLHGAFLWKTNLTDVKLTESHLGETVFVDVDLSKVIGLETCIHTGPSSIDYQTLQQSRKLPVAFLRGVGLPEPLIDYAHAPQSRYHSCFITYSVKDQEFADRVHKDLQKHGVRCWRVSHDIQIDSPMLVQIGAEAELRDRTLLILSEHSIGSEWVEVEITRAFDQERRRRQTVLFPIRLDDTVMAAAGVWADRLRARHIGDFRRWKHSATYKKSLERVLRSLRVRERSE
jgi:hypothetical protein